MSEFQGTEAPEQQAQTTDAAQAEPEAQVTEPGAEAEKETPVAKTYTEEEVQDRIERATAKAAAKAERRAFREATERLNRQPEQQHAQQNDRPSIRQGESQEDFLERLTDWKMDQRERVTQQSKAQEHIKSLETKTESLYAAAEKIPGFDRDEFNELPLTPTIASAITESDVAPKLMAYMATNPDDVKRIAGLSPARQAAEIGKLEARLATSTPSKAPAPITPIGSRGSVQTDPERMSLEQYEKWRESHGAVNRRR